MSAYLTRLVHTNAGSSFRPISSHKHFHKFMVQVGKTPGVIRRHEQSLVQLNGHSGNNVILGCPAVRKLCRLCMPSNDQMYKIQASSSSSNWLYWLCTQVQSHAKQLTLIVLTANILLSLKNVLEQINHSHHDFHQNVSTVEQKLLYTYSWQESCSPLLCFS